MAEPNPSPGLSELVVATPPPLPPLPREGVDLTKPFSKNESASLSVEPQDPQLHGRVDPCEETTASPGVTAHQETGGVFTGAPVSAHSLDVSHSLNFSPPYSAARVTAHTLFTTKIEVKIEPPSPDDCSGNITSYRLQYRELGSNGDWKTCNIRTPSNAPTTYTIENLQPATSYSIRVAAGNSSGHSSFSCEKECRTCPAPQPPSAAPRFTTSSTTDTIRVEIEQTPAESTAYKVQYKEGRNGNWETHDNTPNVHNIDGLRPGTAYFIRVAAVNSCGAGPFSDPKECITRRAPSPPASSPSFRTIPKPTKIIIKIEAPPPVYNVTKYVVQYKMEGDNQCKRIITTKEKYQIPNLQPDTRYLVSIAAVNDDGEGPFSGDLLCPTERRGTKRTLTFGSTSIIGVLLLSSLITLLTFIFYPGTSSSGEVLYKNGSVLVGNRGFNTFFQHAIHVKKTSATGSSGLSFFHHSCNNLPTTNSTAIQVVRKEQQLDTETNIPLYSEYLADGSSVCFHANISGERNLTDCAAAIYIMDNWNSYSSAFIDGNNITDSISKFCLNISSTDQPNLPQCFRVPHSGFFFFGAYIPGKDQGLGVELAVIQTVADKVLYNTSSLRPICEIPSGDGTRRCTVRLSEKKVSTSMMKMCVLMTVQEENADIQTLSYSAIPITIKDFKQHLNLGTVVSLAATALFALILALVLVCVIIKCVNRQRGYQRLYNNN